MEQVLRTSLVLAVVVVLVAPGALAGSTSFPESFTTTTYRHTDTTAVGWGTGNLSLQRMNPSLTGSYDPGWAYGISTDGDYAFVSDSANLAIVSTTSVAAPGLIANYPFYTLSNEARGDMVFLPGGSFFGSTFRVLDTTNPAAPTLRGSVVTTYPGYDVEVAGDYAFVAGYSAGLRVVNISNPSAPAAAGFYDTPGWSYGIDVEGNIAYLADWSSVQVINITNPAAPTFLDSFDTPGSAYGVWAAGNYLFVADYANGLTVINVTDPANITQAANLDPAGFQYGYKIAVDGDVAMIGDWFSTGKVLFYNIADPENPQLIDSSYTNTLASYYGLSPDGEHLFTAGAGPGLLNIDYWDLLTPTLDSTYNTPGTAWDVALDGDQAFVADGANGLRVVDISDPMAITSLGTLDTAGTAYGVAVDGDYAYVADGTSGVQVMSIANPAAPSLLGTYNTPGSARALVADGDYVYVADSASGIRILSVRTPTAPTSVGLFATIGNARGIDVAGETAFVAEETDGIEIVNIASPAAPVQLAQYDTPGTALDVVVAGNTAYIADSDFGVQVLDISTLSAPLLLGSYNTSGTATELFLSGNYLYVADDDLGLQILNVTTPAAPTLLENQTTSIDAVAIAREGDYAFVADKLAGLRAIRVGACVCNKFQTPRIARSTTIDTTAFLIVSATVGETATKPLGTSIFYNVSNDGGLTWGAVSAGVQHNFTSFASDLQWKASLETSRPANTPTLQEVNITYEFDDIAPTSNAAGGAPAYDNSGTIPVDWTASDPWPATGLQEVRLSYRYDSNNDGDFVDVGDTAWADSGLAMSGGSGTFTFDPANRNGRFEFYTRATDNAAFVEAAPAVKDDDTLFDSVPPASNAFNGAPDYVTSGTITVNWVATDATPASGVDTVTLSVRYDSNNDGDFGDLGDIDWADSGLAAQTGAAGAFVYAPAADGRYEFYTLSADKAGNDEAPAGSRDDTTVFDTTAPVTTSFQTGTLGGGGWYRGEVSVILSATDATSGLDSTEFRVDGGAWLVYSTPIVVNDDGTHTLDYRSTDRAGNVEGSQSLTIKIDRTAPATGVTLAGTKGSAGWYVSPVTATLAAADAGSGGQITRWRMDGGAWADYTASVAVGEEGEHLFEFRTTDNAGNVEEVGSTRFKVDVTPPEVSTTVAGTLGENGWYVSPVTVSVTAIDSVSGLATTQVDTDAGGWRSTGSVLLSTNGNHSLKVRAKDVAGNTASETAISVPLDLMAPTATLSLSGTQGAGGWYVSTVQATLAGTDTGSGIARIRARVDGGLWSDVTGPVGVAGDGVHTLEWQPVDRAGNRGETSSQQVRIDSTPPKASASFSGQTGKNGWFLGEVQAQLTASDAGSGVGSYSSRVDGGEWKDSGSSFTVVGDGTHTVEVLTVDAAGNEAAASSYTVKIDLAPPALAVSSPANGAVQLDASALLSGTVEAGATVTVAGIPVPAAGGAWQTQLALAEGPNDYLVTAEDAAGRTTDLTWRLVRDSRPPAVSLDSPMPGTRTTEKSIVVAGTTEPGATVTVNGVPATADASGAFTATVPLARGANTITIVATDERGNEGTVTRLVTRVAPPPDVMAAQQSTMSVALLAVILAAVGMLIGLLILRRMPPGTTAGFPLEPRPADRQSYEPHQR